MARALIEPTPDRVIRGSDYPHLSFADKVRSVELYKLYKLLGRWAPDDPTRQRILVDNPRSGSDGPDSTREKAERMFT